MYFEGLNGKQTSSLCVSFHPSSFLLFSSLTLLFDGPTHPPHHDPLHQAAVSQTWVHAVAFHSFIHLFIFLFICPPSSSSPLSISCVNTKSSTQIFLVYWINCCCRTNLIHLLNKFNKITNQVFVAEMKAYFRIYKPSLRFIF